MNYRRFFDINDLAGLRVEQPTVFRGSHPLVQRLIAEDRLQGLRLDHIDGLRDPAQYAKRLKQLDPEGARQGQGPPAVLCRRRENSRRRRRHAALCRRFAAPPATNGSMSSRMCWSTATALSLWKEPGATSPANDTPFPDMLDAAKRRVIDTMLASEFTVLSGALARIAAGHFSTRDFTLDRLARGAANSMSSPSRSTAPMSPPAAPRMPTAPPSMRSSPSARQRWSGPDPEIFDFLRDTVTLDLAGRDGYSAVARAQLRAQAAAVHRAADGQGDGGHRLLPRSPAAGLERSRRPSRRARARHCRLPRVAAPARRVVAATA